MADKDLAGFALGFKAGGQVHLASNRRVIHSFRRAEVAEAYVAGINSNADLEWVFKPIITPFLSQLDHAELHVYCHPDRAQCVVLVC